MEIHIEFYFPFPQSTCIDKKKQTIFKSGGSTFIGKTSAYTDSHEFGVKRIQVYQMKRNEKQVNYNV